MKRTVSILLLIVLCFGLCACENGSGSGETLSAGMDHTVGLKADGTVVAVAAGKYHTVGLRSDGSVVAVGFNEDGQCEVSGWTDIRLP